MQSQMPVEIYVHPLKGDDTAPGNSLYPLKTLTQALRQAAPGTMILPSRGTYSAESGEMFPLMVPAEITISGNVAGQGGGVVIQGGGIYQSPSFGAQTVTIVLQGNAELRGVTVVNPVEKGTGIWIESAEPTVAGCTITQCSREGILATGTANPLITSCVLQGNRASGATFVRNARGEIRNSLWRQNPFGAVISDQAAPIVSNNQFVENRCGMMLSGQATPILRSNVFAQNQEDGLAIQAQAKPELGHPTDPGGNRFRDNQRFDLRNATAGVVPSVGNQLNPARIHGAVALTTVRLPYRLSPAAAVGITHSETYGDTHWADPFVQPLLDRGIVTRQPDGDFHPEIGVTTGEWATWLQQANLTGVPAEMNSPNVLTRGQAIAKLVAVLALPAGQPALLHSYADRMQLTTAQTRTVAAALAHRLIVSPVTHRLNLEANLSRAEAAALIYQALVLREQVAPLTHPLILAPADFKPQGLPANRRPPVVVIDPGHGGTDFGMVTAETMDESEFGMPMSLTSEEMMSMSPLPTGGIPPELLSDLPPALATGMAPMLPPDMPADIGQAMGDLPAQQSLAEKDLVLSIAYAIAEFLQQQGIQVVLTRPDDRDLTMAERLDIAQRSQADVLISLHANADLANRSEINGVETYYNPALAESRRLAWAVHKTLSRTPDMIERGVHPATFQLLRAPQIPAIHLEVGYITGDKDGMSLTNLAYHRYLGRAVASGIGRYIRQLA